MTNKPPLVPQRDVLSTMTLIDSDAATGVRSVVTRDHGEIRRWAERHQAQPATGEATPSGPATIDLNDGGAGIRFNFPGTSRFRQISWEEWFDNFDRHNLVFVHEQDVAHRAYELWQSRGGDHGGDLADWFEAERQLKPLGGSPGTRYRIVARGE